MQVHANAKITCSTPVRAPQGDPKSALRPTPLAVVLICLLVLAGAASADTAAAFTVSGTVKSQSTGFGLAETEVVVREVSDEEEVAYARTAMDGSYSTAPSISAGTYNIEYIPPFGSGYQTFIARGEQISKETTLNVTLVNSSSVQFAGVLRDSVGEGLVGDNVRLLSGSSVVGQVETGSGGVFSMTVSPGTYRWEVSGGRPGSVSRAVVPSYFDYEGSGLQLASSVNEELTLPGHVLTVRTVGPSGSAVPGVGLEGSAYQPVSSGVTLGGGLVPSYAYVVEHETTNAEGKATLAVPPWAEGSKMSVAVNPPAETQLPKTSFETEGLTEDQTRLVAFGKSGTDVTPPEITCAPPDAVWNIEPQTLLCTASDSGAGLANPEDASFPLSTSVNTGEETATAYTNSHRVCDKADNCAEAGPFGPIKIDRKAPAISISAPTNGAEVPQGATLKAQYTCTDGGSGVATCEGSTASGGALDTSTLGEHTLSVTSTDAVGNHSSASAKYTVVTSDTTPPTIAIGSPEDGEIVNQGTKLTAGYSCSDGESGVASCEGSVPSGLPLDTSSRGEHTLSVASSDHAGNSSSRTVHYTVVEPGECGESARLCQIGLGDETPPSVAGLTLSPTSVDTSTSAKSVTVSVHATDDLSGISAVQVSLSNGSRWISAPASLAAGGTRLNGTWEATLTVPKGSAEGSYALSVAVIDNIGNHRTYSAHELEVLGFPSALTETGSGDTTPPQLAGASASPASVSTCTSPASTTIGVQASDNSGVAYVNVSLIGPGGQSRSASATLDSGSATSGHWSAPLTLPEHAEQGSWSISIQMGDTAGNSTYISSAQLSSAGFASAVQQTCAGDTNPPQIAGVTLTPETIDTSTGARAVVVDVHATDDLSGVGSVQATLTSGGQSQSAPASLQAGGTVLDGTWQATVTLPRWSQQGTWRLSLTAIDQIGNSVSLSPSQITALGLPDSIAQTGEGDSTPPTASNGSIAPSSFDTSQHPVSVSVHLHAADAQSGAELVRVEFTSPNGSQHVYGEASLTSGSPQEGEWTATLEFPQFSQQGSWSPRVELWDAFGNRRSYTPAELTTVFPPVGVALPPEFGRCVKVVGEKVKSKTFYHGGFTTATCLEASEPHTGKYEWEAGVAKTHFTTQTKELSKVTLETVKGAKMVCAGETGTGEYAGLKTVRDVILSFTGCELVKGSVTCTSAGAAAGEVVSQPLEGILGVEELGATSAANKIGLDLYPVGKTGPFMTFACAGTTASIKGSVIVPVAENKTSLTNIWKPVATKGRQQPEHFLEAPVDVLEESLNGATPEQIGLKLTTTQTSEEPVEINTVF